MLCAKVSCSGFTTTNADLNKLLQRYLMSYDPHYSRMIESIKRGHKAEIAFIIAAVERGWKVYASPDQDDRQKHYDFTIAKGEDTFKVDVKARKKISRKDDGVQDKLFWVEIQGVNAHDRGWLYDGDADLLAVECKHSFLLVPHNDLITLVESKVDFLASVDKPDKALYKVYSRPGRDDKVTLISVDDLYEIKYDAWRKV